MEALCSALEARDPHTQAHTGRIRDLSIVLADALQVSSEVRSAVKLGSILHDVGKIGISDSILRKPGPLTDGEWDAMRLHPQIGHDMLRGIEFLEPALPVVLHHHERFDGRGYPWGLTGDAIPMAARIVAVCDAFDAMTCDRIYRSAMPIEQACDEILACAGAQFDPRAAAVLVDVVDRTGTGDAATDMFVRYAI
jgi:HD-GYP domain-containing protein (c-di-GMP phosphodiesterase class II)